MSAGEAQPAATASPGKAVKPEQSQASQWINELLDDSAPKTGNWGEWEEFLASDVAAEQLGIQVEPDSDEPLSQDEVLLHSST